MRILLQRLGLLVVLCGAVPAMLAQQPQRPDRQTGPDRRPVRPHGHRRDHQPHGRMPRFVETATQQPQAVSKPSPAINPASAPPPQTPVTPQQLSERPPVPPQVTFENGELWINAPNSTLSDVLNAVKAKTGANLDLPSSASRERVAVQLGPGPPRDVLSRLLDGSPYDYILLGAPDQPASLTQILLTQSRGGSAPAPGASPMTPPITQAAPEPAAEEQENQEAAPPQGEEGPPTPPPSPVRMPAEQNAAPEPNAPAQTAPGSQVKTPEQLLQELRQMQQKEQQQRQQQKPPQPQ